MSRVFSITELERRQGQLIETGVQFRWDARTRSAPRGNWSFGGALRTVRTDYDGAIEPSEHVLGYSYKDFTVAGRWDDRYAGEGFANSSWQAFEALVKRGRLVRIEFEDVSITGLIKDVDFEYRLKADIGYSFVVSPHYRVAGEQRRARAAAPVPRADELEAAIQDPVEGIEALMDEAPKEWLSSDQIQVVQGDVDAVRGAFDEIATVIDERLTAAEDSVAAVARLAQLFASIRTSSAEMVSRLRVMRSDLDVAVDSVIPVLDFEVWTRGMAMEAMLALGIATDSEDALKRRIQPRTRAIHRGQQNQTLMAVSLLYYGTPDSWQMIQEANGLSSFVLAGGELLTIPDAPLGGV
jgi:hypothetical protein